MSLAFQAKKMFTFSDHLNKNSPKELQLSNKSQVRKDKINLLFFLHDQRVTCFVTFHTYLWICWGVQSTERDMFVISTSHVYLDQKVHIVK